MVLATGSLQLIGTAVGAVITLRLLGVAAQAAQPRRLIPRRRPVRRVVLVGRPSTRRKLRKGIRVSRRSVGGLF